METEIEAKFLDIDPAILRQKLSQIGGRLVYPEREMTRVVLDFPDKKLEKVGGWIRVRDEGDQITLSYKQLNDRTLHGTKEVETTVGDFETTIKLLEAIGLERYSYQETKREKWQVGDVEVVIDTWPWIPTFAEIEADSEAKIKRIADQLGLDWANALHGSVEIAYQHYYDATESEIDNWPKFTFGPIPDWLLAKKR
jgi:adenylate cyclase class 2